MFPIPLSTSLHLVLGVLVITAVLMIAASMPKVVRTLMFVGCGCILAFLYLRAIANVNLVVQLVLYLSGALFFLRNKGEHLGHVGFHDHHFLHYFVTVASGLHVKYLLDKFYVSGPQFSIK